MAATVSAWSKPGAWALDSEEHEEELLQQQKDESKYQLKGERAPVLADFPSLSAAATTKTKKKKAQTLSLAEFSTFQAPKPTQAKGPTPEDLMNLPTGPRERTAEELDRSRLGGGFRSYGANDRNNRSDDSRRQGGFGKDSTREFTPSRADEIDDWGAGKKSSFGAGFDRRGERGERGGFFDSQSKADESDNWASNKTFVPSEGRRFGSGGGGFETGRDRRGGFPSSGGGGGGGGGGADSDNWGRKKEEEGRSFGGGAFDSLRERRGGYESVTDGADGDNSWGKKREEGVGSGRPRLNLQPRKLPVDEGQQQTETVMVKPKGFNPFGDARPREEVLKEKGQDWKEVDEKLESLKIKEKEMVSPGAGSADSSSFGKRSFGIGRTGLPEDRFERSWRKTDTGDVRPLSAEKTETENGHAEEAEERDQNM